MTERHNEIWVSKAAAVLVGRTIKKVRYLTDDERKGLGWSMRSIVIILDDETHIWPSMDDEGNNAGALFTTDTKLMTIPVVP